MFASSCRLPCSPPLILKEAGSYCVGHDELQQPLVSRLSAHAGRCDFQDQLFHLRGAAFSGTPDLDDVDPTLHISRRNEWVVAKLDTERACIILSNLHVLQRRDVDRQGYCKPRREI
ncbi:hypothetical protein DOTSEDRAFT_46903 [Dothistroma septosporum NZE10]|uniref:Uncharacterized protein n=1 Tax=Dothistroma septosporum (strain NZE10 / CBS 128990) TaxID=675120 RepID=N1PD90_DOTSN|nr:hypothetical protein DOTSEDRAFT_46903 [Dothistroma septosporum NZE10]